MITSTRVRSLLAKIPKETFTINQGALYIVSTRGMATSEVGSGAGKGGGSGGRLVSFLASSLPYDL